MTEKKPDPARHVGTGYQWEGLLFVNVWKEIEKRYGRETARQICGDAMYRAGLTMGAEVAKEVESRGIRGMEEAWEILYPVVQEDVLELSEDRFVYRAAGCTAMGMMRKAGLSDEEIADMADAYCSGDLGFTNGFDPDIGLEQAKRVMKGDAECRWVHYLKRK